MYKYIRGLIRHLETCGLVYVYVGVRRGLQPFLTRFTFSVVDMIALLVRRFYTGLTGPN